MKTRSTLTHLRIEQEENTLNYLRQFVTEMLEGGCSLRQTEEYIIGQPRKVWLTLRTHRDNEIEIREMEIPV